MFLSEEEIYQLTKRKYKAKQRQMLAEFGIEFLVDWEGRPVVSKAAVEQKLGYKNTEKMKRPTQPNYDAFKNRHSNGKTA